MWKKAHQTLKITAATVSVANPGKIACNSTVDVVGTIFTNGKGGPITYQWTKDGENLPTGTVTASSGQQQVRVELQWVPGGKGIHHAAAIFQVFTPNVISAQSASFTYTCTVMNVTEACTAASPDGNASRWPGRSRPRRAARRPRRAE